MRAAVRLSRALLSGAAPRLYVSAFRRFSPSNDRRRRRRARARGASQRRFGRRNARPRRLHRPRCRRRRPARRKSLRRSTTTTPPASRSPATAARFTSRPCITSGRFPITASARRRKRAASPTCEPDRSRREPTATSIGRRRVAYANGLALRSRRLVVQRHDGRRHEALRGSRPHARRSFGHEARRLRLHAARETDSQRNRARRESGDAVRSGSAARDRTTCRSAIRTSFSTTSQRTPATPITAGRECEENHHAYGPATDCSRHGRTARRAARLLDDHRRGVLSASASAARTRFRAPYRGGLFVCGARIVASKRPTAATRRRRAWSSSPCAATARQRRVDWTNPDDAMDGLRDGVPEPVARRAPAARPGSPSDRKGSLFVADDAAGAIYRSCGPYAVS